LEESGQWKIALEDFRRLTQNIEDTTESCAEDFWKLRGARDLSPDKAAVLKSVYELRESKAKAQNKPPFKIFSNQVIVEIAQNCPKDLPTLLEVTCLNERLVKRYDRELIKAVQLGKIAHPETPPKCDRPENSVLDRIDRLRIWRRDKGRDQGVPSDVVLPKDVLNRIARENPKNIESLEILMRDVPYRFERFGEEIFNAIRKGNNH
jgi:ribonuclease D